MLKYSLLQPATQHIDLQVMAQYMLPLMQRNMASDGFVFSDPSAPGQFSAPGAIVASPSFDADLSTVTQNYVYNWTRDAAVAAIEIALAHQPVGDTAGSGPLDDYVNFAATCQQNTPTLALASYTIEGQPRNWTNQNDGPALQTLAILAGFTQLDPTTQDTARAVIARNVDFLLAQYQNPSFNLWEETYGQSFFTRCTQLKALTKLGANGLGIPVPAGVGSSVDWLRSALQTHWNGEYYVSILDPQNPRPGYDPNIDIVMASVYGALDSADPRLLSTAAKLRQQWTDPASPSAYPINQQDQANELGPLLGRYPGDVYDGDWNNNGIDHPWALCTANFAQLYYTLAHTITATGQVPYSGLSADFFTQVGVTQNTAPADAAAQMQGAGDQMLQAIVFHSDHLELSEQFDGTTGYEKSVRDLTWSYAAFISATRTRTGANQEI